MGNTNYCLDVDCYCRCCDKRTRGVSVRVFALAFHLDLAHVCWR